MSYKFKTPPRLRNPEEGYDLYADKYASAKNYKFLNSFEQGRLEQFFGDLKGKKALDAGCGTGRLIKMLMNKGAKVYAIDISSAMIKKVLKKWPDITAIKADIEQIPFENETFDIVAAAFVIVHLKELKRVFEECYRVLLPGGIFVVTNINQKRAPRLEVCGKPLVIESYYHLPKHVINALNDAGFVVEKEEFVYNGDVWINQIIRARKPN